MFAAIASPARRAMLDALQAGPLAVHDLAAGFSMSRPAVSQHLRILKDATLVSEEKVGRERRYHLNAAPCATSRPGSAATSGWQDHLGALRDLLEDQR